MTRRLKVGLVVAALAVAAMSTAAAVAALGAGNGVRDPLSLLRQTRNAVVEVVATPAIRRWLAGSGRQADQITLFDPVGMVEDAADNLFVVDRGDGRVLGIPVGHFVWRVAADGRADVIAGTGRWGVPVEGQPAIEADLGEPAGIALDPQARLVFVDSRNHLVLRIEADGRLTRIAGTGVAGYTGGGDARDALLDQPHDVAIDREGTLYIADHNNHRIRRITAEGTITTIAGTGSAGYTGDGGPAVAARLNGPYGVELHPDGRLLIADTGNHVVRAVEPDGTIVTLAGTGEAGNDGDGGPALEARMDAPEALFVDPGGRLLVGDEGNHNVRVVAPDGTISTLIGDGTPGYARVGQPARSAPLDDPECVLVRADGTIAISDGDTGRVLGIDAEGLVTVLAGPAEHRIAEAMRLFREQDPVARAAYEARLRAAGLPE